MYRKVPESNCIRRRMACLEMKSTPVPIVSVSEVSLSGSIYRTFHPIMPRKVAATAESYSSERQDYKQQDSVKVKFHFRKNPISECSLG